MAVSFQSLTIVTYSMDVFERVRDCRDFNIILCGGDYLKKERSFYGVFAHRILDDIHLRKAFVCPSAVSLKNGVCDHQPQIVALQRKLMENSDHAIVLADSSKYEKSALYRICEISTRHIYVSDSGLSKNIKELYLENQCRMITEKNDLHESGIDFG